MFKPEKNLKLSLKFCSFFQDFCQFGFVSQTFAADAPHGFASFKNICNVITGYVGGRLAWTKACLTFTRSLNHKKEGREKRKKWTQTEFSCLSLLYFFSLSLLSLSFMSIFFFTYTREAAAIVFLCMFCFPKTRNLSSLLMTLQEAILLKF